MKAFLLLLVALAARNAFAMLGDDVSKLDAHYGKPYRIDARPLDSTIRFYNWSNYSVSVTVWHGKSIREMVVVSPDLKQKLLITSNDCALFLPLLGGSAVTNWTVIYTNELGWVIWGHERNSVHFTKTHAIPASERWHTPAIPSEGVFDASIYFENQKYQKLEKAEEDKWIAEGKYFVDPETGLAIHTNSPPK